MIAVAGGAGLAAPADRRANQITVDGRTLRYVDSEAIKSTPATAPPFASINGIVGALINVTGYGGSPIVAGVAFGTPASGYRPDASLAFAGTGAYILVDSANVPRYPPVAGSDGLLTQNEVTQTLKSGLAVAARARAQIRRPLGSAAQVSVVVVDTKGVVLGLVRSQDAPVFGTDVAVQKARSAAFFSSVTAAAQLTALPPANYPTPPASSSSIGAYVTAMRAFLVRSHRTRQRDRVQQSRDRQPRAAVFSGRDRGNGQRSAGEAAAALERVQRRTAARSREQ